MNNKITLLMALVLLAVPLRSVADPSRVNLRGTGEGDGDAKTLYCWWRLRRRSNMSSCQDRRELILRVR